MRSKVLKWRIRKGSETLGEGDTFRAAVCGALSTVVGVSEKDLKIQVRLVKNGQAFWLDVSDNHIERIFERLEDKEARQEWEKSDVRSIF